MTRGKPKKLALVASMQQLLVMLKAMRKHNQSWQPQPPAAAQTT
ncbi:hypothetical protein OOK60_04725 [Trichothermofontia sichuanensis B231]|nr:hypothetical protein [Trichothermofontia sichuanensis]UZQ55383.1 hypothetical protein OOK60_04725 [Trichothermofontia sichuanensis B231]